MTDSRKIRFSLVTFRREDTVQLEFSRSVIRRAYGDVQMGQTRSKAGGSKARVNRVVVSRSSGNRSLSLPCGTLAVTVSRVNARLFVAQ